MSAVRVPLRLEVGVLDHITAEVSVEHADAGPQLRFTFDVAGLRITASAELEQEHADALAVQLIRGGSL